MTDGPEPTDDAPRRDGQPPDDDQPPAGSRSPTDAASQSDDQPSSGRHSTVEGQSPGDDADHWVYVVRCADGTLYTGYTTDVERRVAEHDDGEGAKYTRGRTPVELVHAEGFSSRSAALAREHEIKTFSRRRKRRLIE